MSMQLIRNDERESSPITELCQNRLTTMSTGQRVKESGAENDCIEVSVKGKWISVPAVKVNEDLIAINGKWIRIAALHDEEWLEHELTHPELCIATLRCNVAASADIFTFTQKLPDTSPRYSYPIEWFSVAVANIPSFQQWWGGLPQETRKNVRRSQKRGVTIRVQEFSDEVVRGIKNIQDECPIRQGRKYPHYGKTFDQVRMDHAGFAERSDFICAYFGDELVGFLKLVYRGEVASILQLNSQIAHYDKRPSNALLAKAVELCESHKAKYLTYGRFNYGKKSDSSLRDFKIRNGFSDVLVPRYYVPLTRWGRMCVATRLYRGWIGILPQGVLTALTSMRAKWHER